MSILLQRGSVYKKVGFLVMLLLLSWHQCWGEDAVGKSPIQCNADSFDVSCEVSQPSSAAQNVELNNSFSSLTDYVVPGTITLIALLNAPQVAGLLGKYQPLTTWGHYVGLSTHTVLQQVVSQLPQNVTGKGYLIVGIIGSTIAIGDFLADSNAKLTGRSSFTYGPNYFDDCRANIIVNIIRSLPACNAPDQNMVTCVLLKIGVEAGSVLGGEWIMSVSHLTPLLPLYISVPMTFAVAAAVRTEVIAAVNEYTPYEEGVTYSDIGVGFTRGWVMGTMVLVTGRALCTIRDQVVYLVMFRLKAQ